MKVIDAIKTRIGLKNFINYLTISTFFMSAVTYNFWLFSTFKFYYVVLFFIVIWFIFLLKELYFNKTFLIFFAIIVYFSVYNVLLGNCPVGFFSLQFFVIPVHALVFYLLIKFNKADVRKLFTVYLNIAFLVSLIGVIQALAYTLKADKHLYDFCFILPNWALSFGHENRLRVNSIMPEPTSLCMVLMPAFFAALVSFLKGSFRFISKWKGAIIMASFFLTFSTIGYIGFLCTTGLLLFNRLRPRYIILYCATIVLLAVLFYALIPEVKMRIRDTYGVLTATKKIEVVNQSTYTLLRNIEVAYDVIRENIVFGRGLGSHKMSYDRYVEKNRIPAPRTFFVLNKRDANSLFSRLLSETGLIGLVAFFVFIFKCFVKRKEDDTNYLWIINNSIFILFIIRMLRQGNYVSEGFFFFFWLYYFSKKLSKKPKAIKAVT